MKGSPSRGAGRRHAIAAAALALFLERGFGVSVDDVAEAAGASKQTIYKFFGGREGLVRAAMELELERVIGPMRQAAAADGAPAERLALFAEAYQRVLFSADCLAMYRFVIGTAAENPAFGAVFNETVVDYVVSLVTPVIAEGAGVPAAAARDRADVFIGTLQGSELNRALAGVPADAGRLDALRAAAVAAVLP